MTKKSTLSQREIVCDYEQERRTNIAKNEAILQAKGFSNTFVNNTLQEKRERVSRHGVEEMNSQSETLQEKRKRVSRHGVEEMNSRSEARQVLHEKNHTDGAGANNMQMAKKTILSQREIICDYEQERLANIAKNEAILQAKGFYSTFVNKTLQEKRERVSRHGVEEMNSRSEARQVLPEKNHRDGAGANNMQKCSTRKREKQPLAQNLPMAEFFAQKHQSKHLKKRKMQEIDPDLSQLQNEQIQPPNFAQTQRFQEKENSVQHQNIQQKKDLVQAQSKNQQKSSSEQPKKIQKMFCAPGSLSRYKDMRKSQEPRGHQSNAANLHHSSEDSPLVGGDLRSQQPASANAGDLRAQQSNGMNLIFSNDVSALVGENTSDHLEDGTSDHDEVPNATSLSLSSGKKKHRGKTMLTRVRTRTMEERDLIILNDLHQPVGPTKEALNDLTHLLGVHARDAINLPLTYVTWKYVPEATKENIWEDVKKKFIIPEEAKEWVLTNVNNKWKNEKSLVKNQHYYKFETYEERLANRPLNIPIDQFKELLHFWDSPASQEMSDANKRNRDKQDDMHTLGPKSIAVLRHDMQEEDPNKKPPSLADVYTKSRERTEGRTYLTKNEDTQKNIEKMKELKSINDESNEKDPNFDPYPKVMTKKEHSGRLRLFGAGVTKSKLKKKKEAKTPYIIPQVFLEDMAEKMRKTITEQVEQSFAKQMEQQLANFLSKFQKAYLGINLDMADFSTNEGDGASSSRDDVDGDVSEDT